MTQSVVGPTSHHYTSQRLKLHYVDWGNAHKPPLLLIHGGKDHARSWDWVAVALRDHFHVIAPDLRGHGDSAWSIGGSYALVDFTLDIAQLLDALQLFPIDIIGHSMGGSVALQYTGTFPERVKKVIAIEGLGPAPHLIRDRPPHARMQTWIDEMKQLARRRPRRYPSLEEAVRRMQEANPRLTPAQARHLTVHGTYRDEDGTYLWKFDNYVRAVSPYLFNAADAYTLWQQITCPVLLFRGTESWASDPDKDGRAHHFRDWRLINVPGAGHWVHHDQIDAFLRPACDFLGVPFGSAG
jgi:pimeloyl-ACP methyl ester carboxylesterase